MNVLGISGTPRKGGNSEILLDAALVPFKEKNWEINRILLSEKTLTHVWDVRPVPVISFAILRTI